MSLAAGAQGAGAVLFACSRNSIRSPMAAAIARHYFGRRLYVDSVGVEAGEADPFAAAAMAELGIDIKAHKPKSFDALEGASFDLIVTFSPEAHHRAMELTRTWSVEVEYWPMQDPAIAHELSAGREQILETYRKVRDAIRERVLKRFSGGAVPAG